MQDKTIQEFRRNYQNIYNNQIKNILPEFEQLRKTSRVKWNKFILLAVMISIIPALLAMFMFTGPLLLISGVFIENSSDIITIVYVAIFIALAIGWDILVIYIVIDIIKHKYNSYKRKLEYSVKSKLLDIVMQAFGDFEYAEYPLFTENTLSESKLLPKFDNILNDDRFVGTYKQQKIKISESLLLYLGKPLIYIKGKTFNDRRINEKITMDYYTKSQMVTTNSITFRGVFISIDVSKKFSGHTIIAQNNKTIYSGYNIVKLEDIEFSRRFNVYTTDQVESRYLLTPSVMERLKNIQNKFCGKNISCSFKDNNLLIAIPTDKDLFSLGDLDTPVIDTKQYDIFLEELISIFEIIEELKLYENTGL